MNVCKVSPVLLLIVIAMSCSKEESFERFDPNDNKKEEMLLVKVTQQPVGASYMGINLLTYDENQRLIHIVGKIEGKVDNPYMLEENTYFRNQRGDIDSILSVGVTYDKNGNSVRRDSTLTRLYSKGDGQYVYGILTFIDEDQNVIKDSLVYTYDNNRRIIQVKVMTKFNNNPPDYDDFQVTTYDYDERGNVSVMTILFAENDQDPPQVVKFKYNDKPSPFDIGNEGKLLGFLTQGLDSPNGLINVLDSEEEGSWEISYDQFNGAGKPLKALWTNLTTQEKINYTYYYQ